MADKLTEKEKKIAFACVYRFNKTWPEVAADLDYSVRQLYRLRKRPEIAAEIRRLSVEYARDSLPEILIRMTDKATQGDSTAALSLVEILREVK